MLALILRNKNSFAFISIGLIIFNISISAEKKETPIRVITNIINNSPLSLKYPSEYCLEDEKLYKGADFRIGDTNAFLADDSLIVSFKYQQVDVTGMYKNNLLSKLKLKSDCPVDYGKMESSQQLRSDWVAKETGFSIGRSKKATMESTSFFEIQKVSEFKGFTFEKNEKEIIIKFKNTTNELIPELLLMAHYESSGFGKPQSDFKSQRFNNIKKNATVQFKAKLENKVTYGSNRPINFYFHSAKAVSKSENIKIELEIYLPEEKAEK